MSESYAQKRRLLKGCESSASSVTEGRGGGGSRGGRGRGEGDEGWGSNPRAMQASSETASSSRYRRSGRENEVVAGGIGYGKGKSNASSLVEGRGAGRRAYSNDMGEEDQARVLKPRSVQRRSRTAPPSRYWDRRRENEPEARKTEYIGRKSSASRIVEGGDTGRNTQSGDVAEEAGTPILKPRPIRIRSQRAGSMLSSASSSHGRQRPATERVAGRRNLRGEESRDRKECEKGPEKKPEPQIRMSVHGRDCSTHGSAPSLGDGEEVCGRNMRLDAEFMIESGREDKSEVRDGYAFVNGVYHQMSKPGASFPDRPRPKKLQKPQKFKKGARRGCWPWWHGGGGPKCIVG